MSIQLFQLVEKLKARSNKRKTRNKMQNNEKISPCTHLQIYIELYIRLEYIKFLKYAQHPELFLFFLFIIIKKKF